METKPIIPKKILSIFQINEETQNKVYEEIKRESRGDFDFFVLTIFAALIISLGLIISSGAVIIGGMLVAPLVWPILATALAIIKGRRNLLQESLSTLFKASLLVLIIAFIIGLASPFDEFGSEITSRIRPTLFELFIALAAGFIGAFIVTSQRFISAIAGVIIAAAIVPPISVMGICLARTDLEGVSGAFLLYISNLVAVTLAASLFFILARFRLPATEVGRETRKSNLTWLIIATLVICIPLVYTTIGIIKSDQEKRIIKGILTANISQGELQETIISVRENIIVINAVMMAPQNITEEKLKELTGILSRKLDKSVVLKIIVIPTMEAGRIAEKEIAKDHQQEIDELKWKEELEKLKQEIERLKERGVFEELLTKLKLREEPEEIVEREQEETVEEQIEDQLIEKEEGIEEGAEN